MKKKLLTFAIFAAYIALASCDGPQIGPDKNYLPTIHAIVGQTPEKADEYLVKNGFAEYNAHSYNSRRTVYYIKANADSSLVYRISCIYEDQTVSSYQVGLMIHENGSKTACKMYAAWSKYAYNTIFRKVSVWSASILDSNSMNGMPLENYIDGSLAPDVQAVLEKNYESGQVYKEEYDYLMLMFANKRSAFEQFLKGKDYITGHSIEEGFAHVESTGDVPEDVLEQKGMLGRLSAHDYGVTAGMNEWFISFGFDADDWISDAVGPFFGPVACE